MAADFSKAFPRGEDEFEALIQCNKYQVYATARAYLSNANETDTIVQVMTYEIRKPDINRLPNY